MSITDFETPASETTEICSQCGGRLLPQRGGAPTLFDSPHGGSTVFRCANCGHVQHRAAPSDGSPAAEPPHPARRPASSASGRSGAAANRFPRDVPRVLVADEARVRRRVALLGVAIGCLSAVALFFLSPRDSMLEHMFDLRSPATSIPIAITSLFFWGMFLCLWRWRRLRALERISPRSLVVDATEILSGRGIADLTRELDGVEVAHSPVLRRLQAVSRQWLLKPGLHDADLVLQQHVVHDQEGVHAGYSLLRTFIWALPVLGLIGTVIGISLAVGGFATFLGGGIDDVGLIKQNLVNVTGGLSFAFLITLQGLLTSLLLMLGSSTLQTREERLLDDVQQGIAEDFLPTLQRIAPTTPTGGDGRIDLRDFRGILEEVATTVLRTAQDDHRRAIDELERHHADHRREVAGWSDKLREDLGTATRRLGEVASEFGVQLEAKGNAIVERLGEVRDALSRQTTAVLAATDERARSQEALQTRLAGVVAEQARMSNDNASGVSELGRLTRTMLDGQTALHGSLQTLRDSGLKESLDQMGRALIAQAEQVRGTNTATSDLARSTEQILLAQATLERTTSQLQDADLRRSLDAFRQAIAQIAPLLESFQRPFVWQAVPAGPAPGDGR